jgi:CMP-N-acetylneuraminic acid synthetase
MAEFNPKHGYHWSAEEREARKDPVRRVCREADHMREQVRRMKIHAPSFVPAAETAVTAFLDAMADLRKLDIRNAGRKYQPISPEEADRLLAALPEARKPWQDLVTSPAHQASVREANRDIRRQSAAIRERNRAVRAYSDAQEVHVREVLAQADQGDLAGALAYASEHKLL